MDGSSETTSYKWNSAQSAWIFHELQVFIRLNYNISHLFFPGSFSLSCKWFLLQMRGSNCWDCKFGSVLGIDCSSGCTVVTFHFIVYKTADVLIFHDAYSLRSWHSLKASPVLALSPAFFYRGISGSGHEVCTTRGTTCLMALHSCHYLAPACQAKVS